MWRMDQGCSWKQQLQLAPCNRRLMQVTRCRCDGGRRCSTENLDLRKVRAGAAQEKHKRISWKTSVEWSLSGEAQESASTEAYGASIQLSCASSRTQACRPGAPGCALHLNFFANCDVRCESKRVREWEQKIRVLASNRPRACRPAERRRIGRSRCTRMGGCRATSCEDRLWQRSTCSKPRDSRSYMDTGSKWTALHRNLREVGYATNLLFPKPS